MSASDGQAAPPKGPTRGARGRRALAVVAVVVAGVFALAAAVRLGVLIPQVRDAVAAQLQGLKVGRLGRLGIDGLSGDLFRDFRIRRLTLRDAKGVWLDVENIHVSWRYGQILRRRLQLDAVEAQSVDVLRRPNLGPAGEDHGMPVAVHVRRAATKLLLEPDFSYERGVYDLTLKLDLARRGGQRIRLHAASELHAGDHLDVEFAAGKYGPLRLVAEAVEAQGGAIAGALGLPAKQPFRLDVRANGAMSTGQFRAVATSGAVAPLVAMGAWNPQGGQAGGRVLLTASTLTAPYARRFGPTIVFGVAGLKSGKRDYALDAKLRAEALTLHAWGTGDLGERRFDASGLKLDVSSPSVGRLVGRDGLGSLHLFGAVTGSQEAWRFAGAGTLKDVATADYGLAQLSGPLELARTRSGYAAKARLTGAGGRGTGFAAAILGGAPTATLDAERLTSGQLVLRKLDVVGRGLKLEASGGRSILGAVTLKGAADVSNLAAARPGAAGALHLSWQAAQSRDRGPWTGAIDARGEKLALGLAELDRLLGAAPRLQAQGAWQDGRLSIAKATLDGAALDATATGALEADGALGFKADWSATGPFRAGPVEITGHAKGAGSVSGTLAEPRLDLTANFDTIDVPRLPLRNARLALTFQRQADGSSGDVALTAASAYGPARARSAFRFAAGGVDLTGLDVNAGGVTAQGALSLRSQTPSAADLTLAVGPGALLDAGRIAGVVKIADAAGGAQANARLEATNVRAPGSTILIRSARLTADGPLAHLPYTAQAKGASEQDAWTLDGRGVLNQASPGYDLTFDGKAALGSRELHTVEAATFRFGGPEQGARLRLAASDGGRIDLDAALRGGTADVRAQLSKVGLNLFDADFDGRVDATLALQGAGDRLGGTLDARLQGARGKGSPAAEGLNGSLRGRLADGTLALDMTTDNAQGLKANATFTLPAESSAAPFRIAIARQKPIQGRFSAQGEVRPLWDLAIGGERSLSGQVRTEGAVSGTLANPRASGQIEMQGGRFDDGGTGLSLRDVVLKAAFTEDSVDITEARGGDGVGGQLTGQGQIRLQRGSLSNFRLDLRNFRLIDNEQAAASASGQVAINRTADGKVKLSGDLAIDRADVAANPPTPTGVVSMDVKEIHRPPELQPLAAESDNGGAGWDLDVKLHAPNRVYLRGRGLDVELSLDAHVGGTTAAPILTGTARVVRGDYDFAGKRFEFDQTSVVYLSTDPGNIRLQLDATRDDPTLTVTVKIRGTAERPEITLSSSPSLPNDEILASVLFGRSAAQLSPVEAAQVASALSSMAGGGGLDVVGNLRNFARLDRLAFGGDQQSGVTVSGGKYLTDDLYLELTGGGREGPSAQVEWQIKKHLSILSRIAGQAGNRLAIRWRKDY